MNRTEIIADFAYRLAVDDAEFEAWREAHVQQDWYAFHGLHILCDTRYNQFAVYHQDERGVCMLVYTNFGPRNSEHKLAITERQRLRRERIEFIRNRENAPTA